MEWGGGCKERSSYHFSPWLLHDYCLLLEILPITWNICANWRINEEWVDRYRSSTVIHWRIPNTDNADALYPITVTADIQGTASLQGLSFWSLQLELSVQCALWHDMLLRIRADPLLSNTFETWYFLSFLFCAKPFGWKICGMVARPEGVRRSRSEEKNGLHGEQRLI